MIQNTSQKTVFLDIHNVLLFFDWEKVYSKIATYCHSDVSLVKDLFESNQWCQKYEKGEINSWDLFHQLPKDIQGSRGFSSWMEAISNIFKPNDSLVSLVKQLKKNDIKLYTLSNMCEAHFGYAYTHFPILHLFDGHILSYELKTRVPDPKIYEEALLKASAEKENSLYISATEEYVQKAQSLNIDSTIFASSEALQSQLKQKNYLL